MPRYNPTDLQELETRRQSMLLSLTGQFTVVLFRFAVGHWSAGVIGLIVFAVGNRARCSLHNGALTSFVIMGFGCGILDGIDLVQNILSTGTGFFIFPLEKNLLQDLYAISLLLAPVSEVSGARLAWDSFLQPELLMRAPRADTVQLHPGYGPPPPVGPWGQMVPTAPHPYAMHQGGWHWQGPQQPQEHGGWLQGPPQKWGPDSSYQSGARPESASGRSGGSWSHAAYTAIFGSSAQQVDDDIIDDIDDASSIASSRYSGARRRSSRRHTRSTGGDSSHTRHLGPLSSTEPVNEVMSDDDCDSGTQVCAECRVEVPASDVASLSGTGRCARKVYCQACWNAWATPTY